MSNHVNQILVVGTNYMAREYIKVLKSLKVDYLIVGNRQESVDRLFAETGEKAIPGGVELYLKSKAITPDYAIVAVNTYKLYEVTKSLILAGVNNILVEKPGAESIEQFEELLLLSNQYNVNIYIAYNRRFYSSVKKLLEIVDEDGGISSLFFEFTEWSDDIAALPHPDEIKQKWFLNNSSHVVDLAFYLAGYPDEIHSYVSGGLSWHKCGDTFTGCGKTNRGILYSYMANWDAPGRWGIEVLTKSHRLYLRPMERLFIQNRSSVTIDEYKMDYTVDEEYKAGLCEEVKAFLGYSGRKKDLCTLKEQLTMVPVYSLISGEEYI